MEMLSAAVRRAQVFSATIVGDDTMTQPINRMNRLFKRTSVAAGLLAAALGMLAFAPPAAAADNGAPKWKVWTYNPSNRAFKGGVPASVSSGIATFAFPATPDTALLVTDHGSYKGTLLGDLTGKTISATVSASGGPFHYFGEPSCGGTVGANVRLFFQTKSPASFAETDYWWSNPVSLQLNGLTNPTPMSESLSNPGNWSDFFGHFGSDPIYAAAFQAAVKNVTSIGLSFGGGCFFENGVGAPTGGSFVLWSFSAN
jgi:hypothetical protein